MALCCDVNKSVCSHFLFVVLLAYTKLIMNIYIVIYTEIELLDIYRNYTVAEIMVSVTDIKNFVLFYFRPVENITVKNLWVCSKSIGMWRTVPFFGLYI